MQQYFIKPKDKNSSCYYEFYKGKWDKKSFWKEDSICINGDDLFDSEFETIMIEVLTNYNPFGETEVTKLQWEQIKTKAIAIGGKTAIIAEAAEGWADDNFKEHTVFTILGL